MDIELAGKAFVEALAELSDLTDEVPDGSEHEFGREAARTSLAPIAWSRAVGDRLDTTAVQSLLGVTRQSLAKRVQVGSLLGLPGKGTTHYPTWQFDLPRQAVRPEAQKILRLFKRHDEYDPYMVAAWMRTPNEALGGAAPAELLENGKEVNAILEAAGETAKRWAS